MLPSLKWFTKQFVEYIYLIAVSSIQKQDQKWTKMENMLENNADICTEQSKVS